MKTIKVLILVLLFYSCHPEKFPGKALVVANNSNERIFYWYAGTYSSYHYPDTILPVEKPILISSCATGNKDLATNYDPDWNRIFSEVPQGKFTIYFFDKLATTQEEWDDVRLNNMVLRKDVTFTELKNNDYIIYYP